MVDKILVLRKLADIEEYLFQIREYSAISITDYSADWKIQRIIERTLQIMIETCLDIAGHIIADQRYRVSDNYADMFRVLRENTIIDENLFLSLEKMARFRNYVVHHYDKIDPSIVITIIHRNLDDFQKFKEAIVLFLKK
ncbi:MAG: DUF86 domain-containing protein [Bacteroidota bacterium]|jgi:uncharacterized protein YutE (UPF0331/DUF86 family)